jgi:hypothetical protein
MGSDYLRKTILRNLKFSEIILPSTLEKQMKDPQSAREVVSMRDLGISYPTLLDIPKIQQTEILNPRVVLEIFKQERAKILEHRRGSNSSTFGSGRGRERDSMTLDTTFTRPFDAPTSGDTSGGGSDYIKKIAKEMNANDKIKLRRFDFVIQFAWVETPPSVRERKREEKRLAALAKQGDQISSPSVLEGETPEPPATSEPAATPPLPAEPETTPTEPETTSTEPAPATTPTATPEIPTTPEPATTSETPVPPT